MFEYTLHIDAYSPQTIPMARLAEYLSAFADLLGHKDAVHFKDMKPGSTQVLACVEKEAVPKVERGLRALVAGDAAPDQRKAWQRIDDLLTDDNAGGRLSSGEHDKENALIIAFPGATRPRPDVFGPVRQEGCLDGVLVSIGGADKTIHLRLQCGDVRHSGLDTDRATARELAKHLFEPVRVKGTGSWIRDRNGNWQLVRFKVTAFEVLQSGTIRDAIDELRAVADNAWSEVDDPIAELLHLRLENGPH